MIETNPDALDQADSADRRIRSQRKIEDLNGIPILLKDSIDTKDGLNTTVVISIGECESESRCHDGKEVEGSWNTFENVHIKCIKNINSIGDSLAYMPIREQSHKDVVVIVENKTPSDRFTGSINGSNSLDPVRNWSPSMNRIGLTAGRRTDQSI